MARVCRRRPQFGSRPASGRRPDCRTGARSDQAAAECIWAGSYGLVQAERASVNAAIEQPVILIIFALSDGRRPV